MLGEFVPTYTVCRGSWHASRIIYEWLALMYRQQASLPVQLEPPEEPTLLTAQSKQFAPHKRKDLNGRVAQRTTSKATYKIWTGGWVLNTMRAGCPTTTLVRCLSSNICTIRSVFLVAYVECGFDLLVVDRMRSTLAAMLSLVTLAARHSRPQPLAQLAHRRPHCPHQLHHRSHCARQERSLRPQRRCPRSGLMEGSTTDRVLNHFEE